MNIMGIGPQEMMIIAVIALLVFGPGKLPEVMGQAGKLVRDFRRMSAELSGEFEKTIAEAKDATSGLTAELGGMSKEVNSVTNSVKRDLGVKGSGSVNRSKSGTAKTGAASKTGASAKSGAKSTTSKTGGKSATSSSKGSSTSTTTSTSTAARKPAAPVASRDDPSADVSLFEPVAVERPRRARKAIPSVISDPTPRSGRMVDDQPSTVAERTPANEVDDALIRARQRRRNAGYARPTAQ